MSPQTLSPFDPDYKKAFAEPLLTADSLIDVGGRPQISLDGLWKFHIDPYDANRRRAAFDARYFGLLGLPEDEALRRVHADFPAGAWQTARVPGCWNEERPELMHYEGCALYVKEFAGPPSGPCYFLRVGAANYESTLWLNGNLLGRHEGGFTPFCVDVTPYLQPQNVLAIVVDNRREADRLPALWCDWFNYGGITRSVSLVEVPPSHVKRTFWRLLPGDGLRRLRLDVETSASAGEQVIVSVPALGIKERATVDENGAASLEFGAEPKLWSPEAPHLYEVEVALESGDRLEDSVGFREVRVEGDKLLLNGRPVFLRGICAHEEFPGHGRAATEDDTRGMLEAARDLGCNFLRLAHYPHHENAARLADKMGLLLWEEIPVYWHIDFANAAVLASARNQLRELISRDRNRASVIIWSVANETPPTDERLAFLSELVATAREMDPSRLVSAALLPSATDPLVVPGGRGSGERVPGLVLGESGAGAGVARQSGGIRQAYHHLRVRGGLRCRPPRRRGRDPHRGVSERILPPPVRRDSPVPVRGRHVSLGPVRLPDAPATEQVPARLQSEGADGRRPPHPQGGLRRCA